MSQAAYPERFSGLGVVPSTVGRTMRAASRHPQLGAANLLKRLIRGALLAIVAVIYHVMALCVFAVVAAAILLSPVLVFFGTLAVIGLVLHVAGFVLHGLGLA